MKHFPAARFHPPLDGLTHTRAPVLSVPRKTVWLALSLAFAVGFNAAVWLAVLITFRTP